MTRKDDILCHAQKPKKKSNYKSTVTVRCIILHISSAAERPHQTQRELDLYVHWACASVLVETLKDPRRERFALKTFFVLLTTHNEATFGEFGPVLILIESC